MDNPYTAERFSQNVNTKFTVKVDSAEPVDLELVEVAVRANEANEQAGMERFSTFFHGPANFFLPQQTYEMTHPQMGELQIFLVPVGENERGYRYEAVFNLFKEG
jgi:uncharacterized protein DUF6916